MIKNFYGRIIYDKKEIDSAINILKRNLIFFSAINF